MFVAWRRIMFLRAAAARKKTDGSISATRVARRGRARRRKRGGERSSRPWFARDSFEGKWKARLEYMRPTSVVNFARTLRANIPEICFRRWLVFSRASARARARNFIASCTAARRSMLIDNTWLWRRSEEARKTRPRSARARGLSGGCPEAGALVDASRETLKAPGEGAFTPGVKL